MVQLPDVQSSQSLSQFGSEHSLTSGVLPALEWVGLKNLRLPFRWCSRSDFQIGEIELGVNLAPTGSRGIHMSRLYELVEEFVENSSLLDPIEKILDFHTQVIESQQGLSKSARLKFRAPWGVEVETLSSHKLQKFYYPLTLVLQGERASPRLTLAYSITYSSTCPQSAAVSRQWEKEEFLRRFVGQEQVAVSEVLQWLEQGPYATPHAQRSLAQLELEWPSLAAWTQWKNPHQVESDREAINLLIAQTRQALGTESQNKVKRVDEQTFARLNAQNLMFSEDAARKLVVTLQNLAVPVFQGSVTHMESLHPYDVGVHFHSP
ncbi:MAG: GTP cyclohydrolase, FolE2/MptA family [Bdellovibrionaceae bacterium]|jgi:GTP cyclohydrolase I|nr:GTP cyclohydrolase, FolE2/MptA family [Pseudobdellovibrionaceae bacterium]